VHIACSAPTRIDLAGGTIDIWPLYLFHDGATTLNAAISLRAHADIAARSDGRVELRSIDTDRGAAPASGSALNAGMVICPCSMGTLSAIAVGSFEFF